MAQLFFTRYRSHGVIREALTLLIGACFLILAPTAIAQTTGLVAIPPLSSRVTDEVGVLGSSQTQELEQLLKSIEDSKGAQVAILIVRTTKPEEPEQYALRVVEAWKLGRKGVDDGALLLLAIEDRRSRLEVGYGLEGAITDALSKRILDEVLRPHLREGRYHQGLLAAVSAIKQLIDGEDLPQRSQENGSTEHFPALIIALVFVGLAIRLLLKMFMKGPYATISAIGLVFFLGTFAVSIIVGLIASFILSQLTLQGSGRYISIGSRGSSTGGWSSGGGWSGGGGSFGGGGASGSW